ncbi:MAG: hypothetical protein ABSE73_16880 [Planctomycetota bacterium]
MPISMKSQDKSAHMIPWLERKSQSEARQTAVLGAWVFVGAVVILVITWGLLNMVCLRYFYWFFGSSLWLYTLVPTAVIPLLFWGSATTSQKYLSEYSVTMGTASDEVFTFRFPSVGMNVNPLAPNTSHTTLKIITDCLYFGPRVMTVALEMFAKANRLRRLDVPSCAAVIAVLADAGHRMSFQEIADAIDGLNPVSTFPQLHDIDGVLFLTSEPAGLALGTSLKEELERSSQQAPGDVCK